MEAERPVERGAFSDIAVTESIRRSKGCREKRKTEQTKEAGVTERNEKLEEEEAGTEKGGREKKKETRLSTQCKGKKKMLNE